MRLLYPGTWGQPAMILHPKRQRTCMQPAANLRSTRSELELHGCNGQLLSAMVRYGRSWTPGCIAVENVAGPFGAADQASWYPPRCQDEPGRYNFFGQDGVSPKRR